MARSRGYKTPEEMIQSMRLDRGKNPLPLPKTVPGAKAMPDIADAPVFNDAGELVDEPDTFDDLPRYEPSPADPQAETVVAPETSEPFMDQVVAPDAVDVQEDIAAAPQVNEPQDSDVFAPDVFEPDGETLAAPDDFADRLMRTAQRLGRVQRPQVSEPASEQAQAPQTVEPRKEQPDAPKVVEPKPDERDEAPQPYFTSPAETPEPPPRVEPPVEEQADAPEPQPVEVVDDARGHSDAFNDYADQFAAAFDNAGLGVPRIDRNGERASSEPADTGGDDMDRWEKIEASLAKLDDMAQKLENIENEVVLLTTEMRENSGQPLRLSQ